MGLTMGQRKAVTKANATRYKRASKAEQGKILDELCQTTGWHRNHARRALVAALRPTMVPAPRRARTPVYGPEVLAALRLCWAVLGAPTGKRLAPAMAELVPALRRFAELDISDELAALLVVVVASRRAAADPGPHQRATDPDHEQGRSPLQTPNPALHHARIGS